MSGNITAQRTGIINLGVLVIAIVYTLFFLPDKKIWYDETVSVLCSKGIPRTVTPFDSLSVFTSAQVQTLNTPAHVFNATVVDNSNSFIYNIFLHWFTLLAGNDIDTYVLFSKLLAAMTLVALYFFGRKVLSNSIFISLALLFLTADPVFSGMATEIRAYMMGMFFAILSCWFFYKYMYEEETAGSLFWFSFFSLCMLLSHFLSAYLVMALGLILVVKKGAKLFNGKNIVAVLMPLAMFALFLFLAADGFKVMDKQNSKIATKALTAFGYGEVANSFMKFSALNFKAVYPAFVSLSILYAISFLLVLAAFITGRKLANSPIQKERFNILFVLGLSATLFMAAISLYVKHTTAFYLRYFSFSVPFCCLFAAMFLHVLFASKIRKLISYMVMFIVVVPVLYLAYGNSKTVAQLKYSHIDVARLIEKESLTDVEVPTAQDAYLINCFLRNNRNVTYHVIADATKFIVYKGQVKHDIVLVRIDS
jgi:hypothetical protein